MVRGLRSAVRQARSVHLLVMPRTKSPEDFSVKSEEAGAVAAASGEFKKLARTDDEGHALYECVNCGLAICKGNGWYHEMGWSPFCSTLRAFPAPATPAAPSAQPPTHRCNGVNGAERHGTQNKCTICGEYRNGCFDSNGMEVRAPSAGPEEPK